MSTVLVHDNGDLLAAAAAARLITKLADAQAERGAASVVLTGGRTGNAVLEHVRTSPARDAVDWSRVDVYWGDERYVPADDEERNERQARQVLLDHLRLDPRRVHCLPPADGAFGEDVEAAAEHYAEVLAQHAPDGAHPRVPRFDVCMLGVGEEGHTASLFPDTPHVRESVRTVVGVRDCPKPPPARISLTLPAINAATEVWLMTTGSGKAQAVAAALDGATPPADIPAAGARGRQRTLCLLDEAAAAELPAGG
ncbi:6-phosphogluconolactonase [Salinifilum ghardaiensis]